MDEFHGIPPLMQTSPGITEPNITREPLGDEGEMTVGPDNINPFRSAEEAELIDELKRREREKAMRDDQLLKTVPQAPPTEVVDPTAEDDPFVFDDVPALVDDVELPAAEKQFDSHLFKW